MATNLWDSLPGFLAQPPEAHLQALASWGKPKPPLIAMDSPLNFEQRVLNADQYPVLKNKDGSVSTHRMAWGEADDKFMAYPTIVQDPSTKRLRQLGDREAFEYAMKNGEYREFGTPEEASAYADNGYKKFWNAAKKKETK